MAFITIPIFTRLLTIEEYGIISVYATLVGIFAIISGLDLHASIGRGLHDFEEKKDEFLSSVLFLSFVSFTFQFIVLIIFKEKLGSLLNIQANILQLAFISGFFSFIFNFYNTVNVFEKRYKRKSLLSFLNAVSNVFLSILLIILFEKNKYFGRIYGDLFSKILISSVLLFLIFLKGRKFIWLSAWKYSLIIGVPLILHSLSGIILAQFDRLAIQKLVNSEKVGLYSFSYNLGMIPLIVLGALNLAWVPWFYEKMFKNKKEEIDTKVKYYNGFFLIFLSLIYIFVPELGIIMAPESYKVALVIVPLIITSYYMQFLYTIYVNFAFFYKKTFSISLGTLFAGLINIYLNIKLIPIFGYEVAAITTLISYFFLLLFHSLNVIYHLKDRTISQKYIFKWAFGIIILSVSQYFVSKYYGMFSAIERSTRFLIFGFLGIFVGLKLFKKFMND